jgi:hypothetical protein
MCRRRVVVALAGKQKNLHPHAIHPLPRRHLMGAGTREDQ